MSENSDTEQTYKNEFHDPQKWEIKKDDDGIEREYFIGLLPSKAMINKERCGAGITYSEITSPRNSIIVVPTLGIIAGKSKKHTDLIAVSGEISDVVLKEQYQEAKSSRPWVKFIVTPESFYKITNLLKEPEPHTYLTDYFVLLDECHSFVTESYFRINMGRVFKEFFDFKHNALVSATPIHMSDPRINGFTNEKRTSWKTPIDRAVELVECANIVKAIEKYVLQHSDANCHVFCNSLSLIRDVLAILETRDGKVKNETGVFCSYSKKNVAKLGDYRGLFNLFLGSKSKRLNFYTSKYFEGVDIDDKNAVVILATDGIKEHTAIDITTKGYQAIFRIRNKPKAVYHLTTLLNDEIANTRKENYNNERDRAEFRLVVIKDVMSNATYKEDKRLTYLEEEKKTHVYIWGYDEPAKRVDADYFYLDNLDRKQEVAEAYTSAEKLKTQWIGKGVDVTSAVSREELEEKDRAAVKKSRKAAERERAVEEVKLMYHDLADTIHGYRDIGIPVLTYKRYKELFIHSLGLVLNLPFDFRVPFEDQGNATKYHKFLTGLAERFFEIGPENALSLAKQRVDIRSLNVAEVKQLKLSYFTEAIKSIVHAKFDVGQKYTNEQISGKLIKILHEFDITKGHSATSIKDYFNVATAHLTVDNKPLKGWTILSPKAESEIDISYLFTRK